MITSCKNPWCCTERLFFAKKQASSQRRPLWKPTMRTCSDAEIKWRTPCIKEWVILLRFDVEDSYISIFIDCLRLGMRKLWLWFLHNATHRALFRDCPVTFWPKLLIAISSQTERARHQSGVRNLISDRAGGGGQTGSLDATEDSYSSCLSTSHFPAIICQVVFFTWTSICHANGIPFTVSDKSQDCKTTFPMTL